MLIIVEGVDGVGKSTFVEHLEGRIRRDHPQDEVTVLHKGPPASGDFIEEYVAPLQHYVPGRRKHIICDRWHLGEMIYGPMFRGKSIMTTDQLRYLYKFLYKRGVVQVYLTENINTIMERRAARGDTDDMLSNRDQVMRVMKLYDSYTTDLRGTLWHRLVWADSLRVRRNIITDILDTADVRDIEAAW